jgi:hypothetical protein
MTTTTHRAATLSVPYISSANFAAPSALSRITIQNIVGNYASFTVTRTGGGLANYTSPVQNFPVNSFTDPTVLTNNSQYTYTITPVIGGTSGIAFTAIVNPNNAGSPGKIYTLATVSGLNPVYSDASSSISSVYITWSNNGYTTLYLANTTKGGGNYTASGTTYNSTTNGSSDSNLTTNTQYTYTFSCRNGDGYYVANSACQTTVNTCTWASCNAPTFSNTTATGTTLSDTGIFTSVYITYSGGTASPASGTTVTATNTISQNYTSMTSTAYTFVCYPVNALGYQSSNSASATVTPTASSARVWVAVGQGTDTTSVGQGILWTTTPTVASSWVNALSFNPSTYPAANEQFQDVDCNLSTGTFVAGSNSARMYRSTDGKNWTSVAVTSSTFRVRYFSSVNIWIAISGGLTYIVSTNDGVTWSSNYTTNIHNNLYDFATNGSGRWVCCGYIGSGGANGPILSYSDHGNNFASASWNTVFTALTPGRGVTYTTPTQNIQTVIYFNGYFSIMVNSGGYQPYQMYSTDGVNWTISNPQSTITQNNDRLVIDNANNRIFGTIISAIIVSNNNGIGWTKFGNALAVGRTYSMAYADNTLVAVTGNTPTYGSISCSTDNWATAQPLYFSSIMKGVAYNNG